jgi:hypothetical protein
VQHCAGAAQHQRTDLLLTQPNCQQQRTHLREIFSQLVWTDGEEPAVEREAYITLQDI